MKYAKLLSITTYAVLSMVTVTISAQTYEQYYTAPAAYDQSYGQQQTAATRYVNSQSASVATADSQGFCKSCDWMVTLPQGMVRDQHGGYRYTSPTWADTVLGPGEWCFNAWLDQGVTYGSGRSDRTYAPQVYNDMYNSYQMNQLYLTMERRVKENGYNMSLGGRVDLLYGTDYYYTQAYGWEANNIGYLTTINGIEGRLNRWNGDGGRRLAQDVAEYGVSIPQIYAEMYLPIGYGVKVKAGHFYSGMDLESPMANENFFYSHSYASYYGVPTTLTGVQVSADLPCGWNVFGGFDFGWNRTGTKEGGISGLGGVKWTNYCKNLSTQFMIHSGTETWTYRSGRRDVANRDFNVTVLSLMGEWRINSWLSTSLEYVYGCDNKGNFPKDSISSASWNGITNNWFIRCTDTVTVGLRGEWFQDNPQCGRIVYSQTFQSECYNVYDISLGVNWKPTYWCTLRPEVRWDWSDLQANPDYGYKFFGDKNSQFTFGMDLMLNF